MKKRTKWIIGILATLTVLFFVAGFFAGNYFYELALNPNSDKGVVMSASHNEIDYDREETPEKIKEKEDLANWIETSVFDDVYIQSNDNLKLHGSMVQKEEATNRWAIVFHGYASQGMHMVTSAKRFADMGYNILLPDARGLGESEGHYIGMGWHERKDALRWIDMILDQDSEAEIVLYGVSMGGATVMMISGEDLPSNVKAIVEDCGYSSIWGEFAYQLEAVFNLPTFPVMNFASAVTKIRAGYTLEEGSAVKQVAKSVTPIMFIHGDNDTFVPSHMVHEVYDAATCPKEKYVVEGAGHGMAAGIAGEEYWVKVESFINQYLDN